MPFCQTLILFWRPLAPLRRPLTPSRHSQTPLPSLLNASHAFSLNLTPLPFACNFLLSLDIFTVKLIFSPQTCLIIKTLRK